MVAKTVRQVLLVLVPNLVEQQERNDVPLEEQSTKVERLEEDGVPQEPEHTGQLVAGKDMLERPVVEKDRLGRPVDCKKVVEQQARDKPVLRASACWELYKPSSFVALVRRRAVQVRGVASLALVCKGRELGVGGLYLFPFLCLFVVAVLEGGKLLVQDEQERTIARELDGKLLEHFEL